MNLPARKVRVAQVAAIGVSLLAALSLVSGCSKKLTSVDSSYTRPEGIPSNVARMIVYPDLPVTYSVWKDKPEPIGETGEILGTWNPASPTNPKGDSLVSEQVVYPVGAGVIHGLIINASPATGFELLRRESGGGLRAFQDYVLSPSRRWLETGAELYSFVDPTPSGYTPATYYGRGLVQGAVRESSPVTNEARLGALDVADIHFTGAQPPTDSLFTLSWDPVAGTAAYWVHVYEYQASAGDRDRRLGGAPAPLSAALTRDFFVGLLPGTATSYKIGDPGAVVFTYQPSAFRFGRTYLVRISAVNSDGRLIAYTRGAEPKNAIVGTTPGPTGFLTVSPRGAIVLAPIRV